MFKKLTILGAGLLGASVMEAAKKHSVAKTCVAWSRSKSTRDLCAQSEFCDNVFDSSVEAVAEADCVVVCVPVDKIMPILKKCAKAIGKDALVTDVGSTKATICAEAKTLPAYVKFVGSHPMAGSELNGFENGSAELLEGRLCFVANDVTKDRIELAEKFWQGLGMRTKSVDPKEHDRIVASVSHLPHAVAVALSASLAEKPEGWRNYGAGGLTDTTRVAAGDPQVWQAILEKNNKEIVSALKEFSQKLSELQSALEKKNSKKLSNLLHVASEWRQPLSRRELSRFTTA